ncbi:TPR-like protein [Daldinia grandis]|nr:TPR-like protein [Daldinia grandis]
MHIEEISDEVAERLKLSQAEGNKSQPQDVSAPIPAAVFPEPEPVNKKSIDEIVADLKKTPFFMTELEENDQTEAFKALAYEGTPLENGSEFKERGNECFSEKRWADAKEFYTKGVLILAAEERKRAKGEHDPDVKEEEVEEQKRILESLYINRAACHLELKNYRSCWLDCAAALRLNDKNLKAYYRSARAFLAVGRTAEADDACARGLSLDENNGPLQAIARDIVTKHEAAAAKQKEESERLAAEKRRQTLVKAALRSRDIKTRASPQPPDMEDAAIRLVPDPDDPRSALSFPAVLLYPAHLESDFIKAFEETATLADHLAYVFPLPWDAAHEYTLGGVECYMETAAGGLVRVGKKVPLLKMLMGGKVEVVDEVVRVFVLPRGRAEGWVREFKEKRRAERGA